MKYFTQLTCIILLISLNLSAQKLDSTNQKIFQFKEQTLFPGENIDIVYQKAVWEIDPAVVYIKGSVKSLFKPIFPQIFTISFDLSDSLIVDSILYHHQLIEYQRIIPNQLDLFLDTNLTIGLLDSVTIFYQGIPQFGTGQGSFEQGFHNGFPIVWTFSQPYGAYDWWPCKNDLSDKIDSMDIFVKTPLPNRVASVGVLVDSISLGNSTLYHWKHRYPIAASMVGIAVTNYLSFSDFVEVDGEQLEILNYIYPEVLDDVKDQASIVLPIISLFSDLFIPYPFLNEKYGQAMFQHGGGLQTPTMSFIGSFTHDIMAHELAHMWFCNYITTSSWHEIWLNEGFATYCTGLSFEHLYDGYYWPIWKENTLNTIISEPDGSTYVYDINDANRIYDSRLTYHKGAYIVHMIRWLMGDEQFYQAIRNYLNDPDLAHGYASTQDLKNHLEEVSGLDFSEFFNMWLFGEGYPSYSLNCTVDTGTQLQLSIDQSQSHPSVSFFKMPLPVMFHGFQKDTIVIFDHQFSGQEFSVNLGFLPDSISIDPEKWLISGSNTCTLDVYENNEPVISIGPNPVSDLLNIEFQTYCSPLIDIVDINGELTRRCEFSSVSSVILDIASYRNGLYFIIIYIDDYTEFFKVIKL